MTPAAAVVAEARAWAGTPFHHLGRQRGVAADCAGLVIGTAHALHLLPDLDDVTDYAPWPVSYAGDAITRLCSQHLTHAGHALPVPGAVVLLAVGRSRCPHLGIWTNAATWGIVHANQIARRVVETGWSEPHRAGIVATWLIPGVTYG